MFEETWQYPDIVQEPHVFVVNSKCPWRIRCEIALLDQQRRDSERAKNICGGKSDRPSSDNYDIGIRCAATIRSPHRLDKFFYLLQRKFSRHRIEPSFSPRPIFYLLAER